MCIFKPAEPICIRYRVAHKNVPNFRTTLCNKVIKLEKVAIARHCNFRHPGLPPAPRPPWRKNGHARKLHLVLSKCELNFNFIAPIVSEIWWGPKFTLGGAAPLWRPLRKNFISLRLIVSEIIMVGSSIYTRGLCTPARPLGGIFTP